MTNRQIENNYETIEEWVGKYNLFVGDVGEFGDLSFAAPDVVGALNINKQSIVDTVAFIGPASDFNTMNADGLATNDVLSKAISVFYTDYKTLLARGTTLTTSANGVITAVNELDAEIGDLSTISNEITGADLVTVANNVNNKINTSVSTLNTSISSIDTKVGSLSNLSSGFTGVNDDNVVSALNFLYDINTGETAAFTDAVIDGTLDVAGVSTFAGVVNMNNNFTTRGIEDKASTLKLEVNNNFVRLSGNTFILGDLRTDNLNFATTVAKISNENGEAVDFSNGSISVTTDDTLIADFTTTSAEFYKPVNVNSLVTASGFNVGNNEVYHAGNDGPGSGLNADLLDGLESSSFARVTGNQTFNNNVTVLGDLNVQGEINAISSNELDIGDSFINLNQDQVGTPVSNAGIRFGRGSSNASEFFWDEADDRLKINNGTQTGTIYTTLDAIDADTLGGEGRSFYLAWSNLTGLPAAFTPSSHTHSAGEITSGIFNINRIPDISAAKTTSGVFDIARIPSISIGKIVNADILKSTNTWSNSNSVFATAAAIESRILSKGYTTNVGDVTGVSAGNGLVGGGTSGKVTVTVGSGTGINVGPDSLSVDLSPFSTDDISEGNNLYYTTGRASAQITGQVTKAFVDSLSINSTNLQGLSAASFTRADANDNVTGHTEWQDGFEVRLGNSADMRVHHTSNNNYMDVHTGDLFVRDVNTTKFTFDVSAGDFTATGDITGFSDANLKTDIKTISSGLQSIESIRPIYYKWNDKAKDIGILSNRKQSGVLAQDIEKIFPEALGTTSKSGYKTVAYDKLVPLLIAAVQELSEKVKVLEDAKAK